MGGNLFSTILAIIFYLTSGIMGKNIGEPPQTKNVINHAAFPYVAAINADNVVLRESAQASGIALKTLQKSERVLILSEQKNWLQAETTDNKSGWVTKWNTRRLSYGANINNGKIIAAYYVKNGIADKTGYSSLSENLASINRLIPFSYEVNRYGNINGNHEKKAVSLIQSTGGDALALINNVQSGNFNSSSIHHLLNNSANRSRAISGIKRILTECGYQGVNIDFENVPAADRTLLTQFFKELAFSLHQENFLVTASIPAKTYNEKKSPHSGAYDYTALAQYLDQVMIMTYDEHYSGGTPGAVASYPWVEKVINYSLQSFRPEQIILGLAGYGYDWSNSSGKARSFKAIERLAKQHNVSPKWDSVNKVPHFNYQSWGKHHEVWYENSHSTAAKMVLVQKYNLRGVVLWRLGYEEDTVWETIQTYLKN